jgi:glycosyltransferase involved in cell wall biosynthesis
MSSMPICHQHERHLPLRLDHQSSATSATHLRVVLHERAAALPIIAICHLQWDWVWQRPQQFLSRLAKDRPVLFVQTHRSPVEHTFTHLRAPEPGSGVTVIEVHLPTHRWDDGDFIDGERRRVLQEALRTPALRHFAGGILWFNDPMAVTAYAGHLDEALIVYDCMDELTQFNGAPPALAERERELTARADLIFCGGRKMRDKRLPLNANTHFFGTGVDCAHFGSARRADIEVDACVAGLPKPVLGYFGVIDERIDYGLIAALAEAFPQGSIAMVGPFAKVDPAALPHHPNIHWLGSRPYAQLPAITKGFDVCLMPFALNASTEFINPTKALEYLATARPVVSTALDEVRTNFSEAVRIGRSHEEFIAVIHEDLACPSAERIAQGTDLATRNTWEAITAALSEHIARTYTSKVHGPDAQTPARVQLCLTI